MYGDIATSIRIENVLRVYNSEDKKIDIIDNFNKFGVSVYRGFAFFHAFAGCDIVSSFYKVGKAKFWAV